MAEKEGQVALVTSDALVARMAADCIERCVDQEIVEDRDILDSPTTDSAAPPSTNTCARVDDHCCVRKIFSIESAGVVERLMRSCRREQQHGSSVMALLIWLKADPSSLTLGVA